MISKNEDIPTSAEKSHMTTTPTLAAEIRKSNKPLMEKRRRERINNCLDQLKMILMEVNKKESSYYSKLEKADILEMTVKYLRNIKRLHATPAVDDQSVIYKYVAGYNKCRNEVERFLESATGVDPEIRTRLIGHLAECLQRNSTIPTGHTSSNAGATQGATQGTLFFNKSDVSVTKNSPLQQQQLTLQLPLASSGSSSGQLAASTTDDHSPTFPHNGPVMPMGSMQLLPAWLPNGETIYILANTKSQMISASGKGSTSSITPVLSIQPLQRPDILATVETKEDLQLLSRSSPPWSESNSSLLSSSCQSYFGAVEFSGFIKTESDVPVCDRSGNKNKSTEELERSTDDDTNNTDAHSRNTSTAAWRPW